MQVASLLLGVKEFVLHGVVVRDEWDIEREVSRFCSDSEQLLRAQSNARRVERNMAIRWISRVTG